MSWIVFPCRYDLYETNRNSLKGTCSTYKLVPKRCNDCFKQFPYTLRGPVSFHIHLRFILSMVPHCRVHQPRTTDSIEGMNNINKAPVYLFRKHAFTWVVLSWFLGYLSARRFLVVCSGRLGRTWEDYAPLIANKERKTEASFSPRYVE